MTPEDLLKLIRTRRPRAVLKSLAALSEKERRSLSPAVLKLFRMVWDNTMTWNPDRESIPQIRDTDSARIALLATSTPSEMARFHFQVYPQRIPLKDVIAALRPSWTDTWVASKIEENPIHTSRLSPLWEEGLCARPETDALILSYYASHNGLGPDAPEFSGTDVWRFFEVEGEGEFSLASHDKYSGPAAQWSSLLKELADEGKLDRARLLDASLDALERDFAQFRAGWYSRFHSLLEPTLPEMTERVQRYLRLVSSDIPPTVSFALKMLKTLEKHGEFDPSAVLSDLEPALVARQKASVTTGLQFLRTVLLKDPGKAKQVAGFAVSALISEAADIQGKALDIIEKSGAVSDPDVRVSLEKYTDFVVPSLKERMAEMTGVASSIGAEPAATCQPSGPLPVLPATCFDEAFAVTLAVLENQRDPFEVERAIDGLSRFGAEAQKDKERLSPLRQRAGQIIRNAGEGDTRYALAISALVFCDNVTPAKVLLENNPGSSARNTDVTAFSQVFLDRNLEVLHLVEAGYAVPMVSMPSDTSGCVSAADLVARMMVYRALGATPGNTDLNLALLRLSATGRKEALKSFSPAGESEHAVAEALGGPGKMRGDLARRVSVWAAQQPREPDEGLISALKGPLADAGVSARLSLDIMREDSGDYHWGRITVKVSPERREADRHLLPALFYPPAHNSYWDSSVCPEVFADVAWASLMRPEYQEPFARLGILAMETDQKLTDHHCRAYLEPWLRPGSAAGPVAASLLAYYLASADKSVTSLTVSAISLLVTEDRLTEGDLAQALREFIRPDILPLKRWTDGLSAVAVTSAQHASFVRRVIAGVLELPPDAMPRQSGGLLELLYELHVAADAPVTHEPAVAHLSGVTAGGKTRQFARKLVAFAT